MDRNSRQSNLLGEGMSEDNKNKSCWECRVEGEPLEQHHPVPRSRGGTRTISLCSACHSKAHHRKKNVSISKLTKEGLARKMATGWKAGQHINQVNHLGREAMRKLANAFAKNTMPTIKELMARDKIKSYKAIAEALNREGVKTARGKKWYAQNVKRIFIRCNESLY